jgi:hypothetical protein
VHLNRKFFASTKTWLEDFLSKCGELQAMVLAVTFWHLWDVPNKLRSAIGCMIQDIKSLVARFNSVFIVHVSRLDFDAYFLARSM